MQWRHNIPSLVMLVILLSGCSTQLKWFGAGGVCTEWDEVNYKAYYDKNLLETHFGDRTLTPGQAEFLMREAEEAQRQLDFGSCSENDLANRTCN